MSEEGDGDAPPAAMSMRTVHVCLHGTVPVFDSTVAEWAGYVAE